MSMLERIFAAALASALVGALSGCAADDEPGGEEPPDVADAAPAQPDAAPPPPPGFVDEVEPRLVGTYAMKMQVATIQMLPILGNTPSTQTSLGLVEISRDGEHFVFEERGCRVVPQAGGAVTTTIDDAVPRSVPPGESRLDVTDLGDGQVGFARATSTVVLGIHLADPATDALTDDAADPRVWDQDGDGKPGVTAHVMGLASGDVYVVQRQRASYSGTLLADGKLRGLVADASEQKTVGASTPLLDSQIMSTPDPDTEKSFVELERVTGTWDCDRLVAEVGTIFP